MKSLCQALIVCIGLLFGAAGLAQDNDDVPLKYAKVDLTDGRKLKNVVVKTYNAKSDLVLLVADGKAMLVPLAVFPAPLNERLKSAPASGASVNSVPTPSRPMATAADQYRNEVPVPVPAVRRLPSQPVVSVPGARAADPAVAEAARLDRHRKVAAARAERYYRFEHQFGSNAIKVTALSFEFGASKAIPGYSARVETKGKAYIELFDAFGGGSFQRATSTFEIVTEEDPKEGIIVIDLIRKS